MAPVASHRSWAVGTSPPATIHMKGPKMSDLHLLRTFLFVSLLPLLFGGEARATDYVYRGSSTFWSHSQAWLPVGVPGSGDTVVFGPLSLPLPITTVQDHTIDGIRFESSLEHRIGGFGNLLTLETVEMSALAGSPLLTIDMDVELSAAATWEIGRDTRLWIGGDLSGSSALTKTGAGSLQLAGNNDGFAGNLTVSNGGLFAIGGQALSDTRRVTLSSGTELELDADETLGAIAGSGTLEIDFYELTLAGSQSTTFRGDIAADPDSSLVMNGTGTFRLESDDSDLEFLTVNSGTLLANNDSGILASAVSVGNGGVFGGNGRVGTLDVLLGADLVIGDPVGTLHVDSVDLNPASTTFVDLGGLDPDTGYGRLVVDAGASLGGFLQIGYVNGFQALQEDVFVIVVAGNLSGTFNSVSFPDEDAWSLDYDYANDELVLTKCLDEDLDRICDVDDLCIGDDTRGDTDGDGFCDDTDNCVDHANPGQGDCDQDGEGDVCEIALCAGSPLCGDCNSNGVPDGCDDTLPQRNASFDLQPIFVNTLRGARSVHTADMDGNGTLDVVAAATGDNRIRWWSNTNGDASAFQQHTVDNNFEDVLVVVPADVDGDLDLDLVGGSHDSSETAWWENVNGDGTEWTKHLVHYPGFVSTLVPVDVDLDGDIDIVSGSRYWVGIAWWENTDGSGTSWANHTVSADFRGPAKIVVTDIDGDGFPDVAAAGNNQNEIAWWSNDAGDGSEWTQTTVVSSFLSAESVAVADMDGDGDADFVATSGFEPALAWFEDVDGTGTSYQRHDLPIATTNYPNDVTVSDLDGDGDLDVAANGENLAWWRNDGGLATVWTEMEIHFYGVDAAEDIAVADLDNDGRVDLIDTQHNTLRWWSNVGGHYELSARATVTNWEANPVDDALKLTLTHNGEAGDADLELGSLGILFENESGVPLEPADLEGTLDSIAIYADTGSESFEVESDQLLTTVDAFSLVDGVQTISVPAAGTNRVAPGGTAAYFVVADLTEPLIPGGVHVADVTHLGAAAIAQETVWMCPLVPEGPVEDVSATISYVPEPGGIVMLLSGALLLRGLERRRTKRSRKDGAHAA